MKTDTFFDDGAARRNRIIYILCALVVGGCAVAFFLISSPRGERNPTPVAKKAKSATPDPKNVVTNGSNTTYTTDLPNRPPQVVPGVNEELRAADGRFEGALTLLREARDLGPGSEEGTALRHRALAALVETQNVYEAWLEAHPDDEHRYASKLADIRRQVFWTRKNLPATAFPNGDGGEKTERDPEGEPAEPVDVPRPVPTPPKPTLPPDRLLRRYLALVPRAAREGRPRPLVIEGRKLLEDERLTGSHDRIRRIVTSAEDMVAFLDAAALALEPKIGRTIALDLRSGRVNGLLVAAGEEITLEIGDGESTYPVSDLSAAMLLSLAAEAEFLTSGFGHRTAGGYLFHRGDREPGLDQLLRARAQGADLGPLEKQVQLAMKGSRPLQALADWLELEPRLEEKSEEILTLITDFRARHRDSALFRENREALFAAAAAAASHQPFTLSNLWIGESKLSGRGKLRLAYDFGDPEQIRDFEQQGTWRVEGGSLIGEKGTIWLERFDLTTTDLEFTLPAPMPVTIGLWSRDRSGKGAVNLTVVPEAGELKVALRHGDRPIGTETIRMPSGRLTFSIQRRDEKYQVRLNRKVLLKGTDLLRHTSADLYAVGISARLGPVEIEELSVATTIDLAWAKAGGNRFSTWIRDWYVTVPLPVTAKSLKLALVRERWPETGGFAPEAKGGDGKPLWHPVRSPTHWVDLKRLKPNRNVVTYQAIRVWSPKKRTAILELVADDAARAWLNGSLVIGEAPLAERQRVSVKLRPGDNVLLVKVLQAGGAWYTATRFLTKDGGPIRELSYW